MRTSAIILAAGSGKRMKSSKNKVLHNLCGQPIVSHVISACEDIGVRDFYVVIGRDSEQVQASLGPSYNYVLQEEQLGTGHATMQVVPHYQGNETIIVLCGDAPLIRPETLQNLLAQHQHAEALATILTAKIDDPSDYGRIVRDMQGNVLEIVEAKDATREQKMINEINTGFFCFQAEALFRALGQIKNNNAQGEYYLTDVIAVIAQSGGRVTACPLEDMTEALGINDRVRLAEAEGHLRRRIREKLMLSGVTFMQPETCLIDATVKIGQDTVIYPGTIIEGDTVIGSQNTIGPNVRLIDCQVGDNCLIEDSVARQASLGNNCAVGPYAYLRPNTVLSDGVKVGDFVELKNSRIGAGTKINHLSYVGDADVGEKVNIGAGTILVNYDGKCKYRSTIEDSAFIGCNSNIVSPVQIGKGAYIAAGSTITEDVPPAALAIGRARQVNKEEWAKKRN